MDTVSPEVRKRHLCSEASAELGCWNTEGAKSQRGIMEAVSDPEVHTVVVMSAAQTGKALAIDTPVATPDGWATMGDVRVGDTVFDADGIPVRVSYVSPVMQNRQCYRICFSDGASIVADADHQWLVESDTPLNPSKPWGGRGARSGVLTTKEIAGTARYGSEGQRARYAIPVGRPLDLPELTLPIEPYVLGVWLGDGHSYSARVYCHADDAPYFAGEIEGAGFAVTVAAERSCSSIRIDPKRADVCPRGHNKNVLGWSGRGCAECVITHPPRTSFRC